MRRRAVTLVVLVVVCAFGALAWNKYDAVHRDLARQRDTMDAAWKDLDQALQDRAEVFPPLVDILRGYATESTTFHSAAVALAAFRAAKTPNDKLQMYDGLEMALARLLLLSEHYPKLRTDSRFRRVDDDLKETESGIQKARLKYNEAAQRYNAGIEQFPLVARLGGFKHNDAYFKTKVEF